MQKVWFKNDKIEWKIVTRSDPLSQERVGAQYPEYAKFGVAIDLGTTNICMALCDLGSGEVIKMILTLNPQIAYGSDVISRLSYASQDESCAKTLQGLVLGIFEDGVSYFEKTSGVKKESISKIYVSGNSAMIALLLNDKIDRLLNPDTWSSKIAFEFNEKELWIKRFGVHVDAQIEVVETIGGFVGSDILCGLQYIKMHKNTCNALFIDFGTNSEIALWDGKKIVATSAAGGPAFEGYGIDCGMAAVNGAIHTINEEWSYKVIGNEEPKGVCGSGLIDVLALLLKEKKLLANGRIRPELGSSIPLHRVPFSISTKDIDQLQRAKAAIAAGIEVLLNETDTNSDSIEKIYFAGAFGAYINPINAISIGLIPACGPESVVALGNSSLYGCLELMLCADYKSEIEEILSLSSVLNLAGIEAFESSYFENLFFKIKT